MTPPLSQTSRPRRRAIALYVGYGVILIPLAVVFSVAFAFFQIGGSFVLPTAVFLVAFVVLWLAGLLLSLVLRSVRVGAIGLVAVAVTIAAFVAWVALAT